MSDQGYINLYSRSDYNLRYSIILYYIILGSGTPNDILEIGDTGPLKRDCFV